MRAKIDLRVELLDGQDAGYVLSEENRIVELDDIRNVPYLLREAREANERR